jgi:hypothetical protein
MALNELWRICINYEIRLSSYSSGLCLSSFQQASQRQDKKPVCLNKYAYALRHALMCSPVSSASVIFFDRD